MKNEIQPNQVQPRGGLTSQVILGLIVIAMGLVFLLDNLEIIDMHRAFSFWPVFFIVVGTVKLCDTTSEGGRLVGGAMLGLGVLLVLDRLDIIYFSWRAVWPLALIGLGALLLAKGVRNRRRLEEGGVKDGSYERDVVDITAIMGGFERRVLTPSFRGGEITAVMGGCALDLRNASIEGEAVLNVFAFWGGVTLKCPPDWTVVLQGTPIMGGFEDKTITPPDGSKRLLIRGYAIMGGVEVRN